MSRIEKIETQIEELSPEEMAAFRQWFANFDAELWDRQFEADVAGGSWTASRNVRSATMPLGGRRNCDSSRLAGLLGVLPPASRRSSNLGRSCVCAAKGRPATPISPFQEDRTVLVGPRRPPLPCCRNRGARRHRLVLDRDTRCLRQDSRLALPGQKHCWGSRRRGSRTMSYSQRNATTGSTRKARRAGM